jgi:hypothetical protein
MPLEWVSRYTIRNVISEGGCAAPIPLHGDPLLHDHEELEACCLGARTRIVGFALLYVVRSLCFKAQRTQCLKTARRQIDPLLSIAAQTSRHGRLGGCLGLASFWQIVERRSRPDSFDPTAAAHLSPRPLPTLSSKAQSKPPIRKRNMAIPAGRCPGKLAAISSPYRSLS